MKKYLPILLVFVVLIVAATIVISKKNEKEPSVKRVENSTNIGTFSKQRSCARLPKFLKTMNIPQPVTIDLSQKEYKGIALLYGKNYSQVLHPKQWEQFDHLGTYSIDGEGNIYLVPMPFISIYPATFNLQKNIYTLDTLTGKLSIFMHLDDVYPSANNPYGINAIVYDCDDHTLWVSAIDESTYQAQKGVLYHIDIQTKTVIEKLENVDALSLALVKSNKGKFLLLGAAKDNALYAYTIEKNKINHTPIKITELPNVNAHIRKIKIKDKNKIELQSIPFSYTLISQTAQVDRKYYELVWDNLTDIWNLKEKYQ